MSDSNQLRRYDPSESAVFLKTRERFGGLSNMAAGFPLIVNGIHIRTSEALYQACRYPHLPQAQDLIIRERSPMTAKMRSKSFLRQTRPDWQTHRLAVMRWCLRVKLVQNWSKFGSLLLSTGQQPIVEMKSRRSDYWGAQIDAYGNLVGMNVLGRLLMELRQELEWGGSEAFEFVDPLPISSFLLLGEQIQKIWRLDSKSPAHSGDNSKSGSNTLGERGDGQLNFWKT